MLDSESTVHAFCNRNLVERVWTSEESMTLVTNGGEIDTQMKCAIKRLDPNQTVWFHPEYITNVLSLALLKKQFRITYDSTKGGAFVVHRPGKENMHFHCYSNSLHMIEPSLWKLWQKTWKLLQKASRRC